MNILIVGFTKIKYMPYINFYLSNISSNNKISILYWNRDLKSETLDPKYNYYEFKEFQKDDVKKISKIKNFIKYRKFAMTVLKKENWDLIIVMHSIPAVLISKYLIKNYKEKYIFDYRDFTYESFIPFKNIVGKLVKNSKCTFVSSDKYKKYLPSIYDFKTFISHNILISELDNEIMHQKKKDKSILSISFWGFIREKRLNIRLIDLISKDNRFELHYYGREQEIALSLKKYVKDNNINNVFFHGEYSPNDRFEMAKKTDLIHNIYCSKNSLMSMGNKYYDGILFKIPQICFTGSNMGTKVTNNKIGIEFNPYNESNLDTIYYYYKKLNDDEFSMNCHTELERIKEDLKMAKKIINEREE